MSRWIDFDFVKSKKRFDNGKMKDIVWMQDIYHAPSIDLVTCAECKYKQHCGKAVEHTTYEPTSITIECKPVDFCSYGERDDDE